MGLCHSDGASFEGFLEGLIHSLFSADRVLHALLLRFNVNNEGKQANTLQLQQMPESWNMIIVMKSMFQLSGVPRP